jgi:hypothetical protein
LGQSREPELKKEFSECYRKVDLESFKDESEWDDLKLKLAKEKVKALLQKIFNEIDCLESEEERVKYELAEEDAKAETVRRAKRLANTTDAGYHDEEAEDLIQA